MFEGGENKEKQNFPHKEDNVEAGQSGYGNKNFGIDREDLEKYKNLYGKGAKRKGIKKMAKSEEKSNFQGENLNNENYKGKSGPRFYWLSTKEEAGEIKNNRLRVFVVGLAKLPPDQLDPKFLLDRYGYLQNLAAEESLSPEEIESFEFQILEKQRFLKKQEAEESNKSIKDLIDAFTDTQKKQYSEIEYGLPEAKNIEEQREFVRHHLDIIENSNRDCSDFAISARVTGLEANLERMADSVRDEVEARLSLHDCYALIRQAGGWLKRPEIAGQGLTIGGAASIAEVSRNHGLDRKKIVCLLTMYDSQNKMGMPGLKIAEAWDYLQKLNDADMYPDFIHEVNKNLKRENKLRKKSLGKDEMFIEHDRESVEELFEAGMDEDTVFYTDSDNKRKAAVRDFIIGELVKLCDGDYELARKSFQLADKLTVATLETSVFNRKTGVGNDELGDIIGLQRWRKNRENSGRDRGPDIHFGEIEGFGSSFLRFQIGKVERKRRDSKSSQIKKEIKVLNDNKEKIWAQDVLDGQKEIKEGSYSYFCAVKLGRISALNEALLDLNPKPGSINRASLQKAIAYFDLVDKGALSGEEADRKKTQFKANKEKMDQLGEEIDKEIEIIKENKSLTEEEEKEERLKREEQKIKERLRKKEAEFVKFGDKKLRLNWIAGIVDQALDDFYLEWDANAFTHLRKAVTQDVLSKQKGTFLLPEHWNWIMKATNFNKRLLALTSDRFRATFKPKF